MTQLKETLDLILTQMEIINSNEGISFEKKIQHIERLELWLFSVQEKIEAAIKQAA